MFCGKCGAQNADGAQFCTSCGARIGGEQPVQNPAPVQPVQPVYTDKRHRKVGIIAVVAIVVVVALLGMLLFGGRSYKSTVDQFVTAAFKCDVKKIMNLIPKEMRAYVAEQEGYDEDEMDEMIDEASEMMKESMEWMEEYLGGKIKVSHEIVDVEDFEKEDLKQLKEKYKEYDVKVSDAKTVEVEMTVKGKENEQSTTQSLNVIKVGRSWYIDVGGIAGMF